MPQLLMAWWCKESGGSFTNVSRALQRNLAKIHNAKIPIYGENFKLKLCTCAQSMALGTHTKFQLEILIRSTIFAIHKFREKVLESSRNVSETTSRVSAAMVLIQFSWNVLASAPEELRLARACTVYGHCSYVVHTHLFVEPGPVFHLWVNKVLANDRGHEICKVFSHWPKPCSHIDTRWAQIIANVWLNMHVVVGNLLLGVLYLNTDVDGLMQTSVSPLLTYWT